MINFHLNYLILNLCRKMVYLGYDFDFGKINDIPNEEPNSVRESLSPKRIKLAKNFLESVRDFIAIEVSRKAFKIVKQCSWYINYGKLYWKVRISCNRRKASVSYGLSSRSR